MGNFSPKSPAKAFCKAILPRRQLFIARKVAGKRLQSDMRVLEDRRAGEVKEPARWLPKETRRSGRMSAAPEIESYSQRKSYSPPFLSSTVPPACHAVPRALKNRPMEAPCEGSGGLFLHHTCKTLTLFDRGGSCLIFRAAYRSESPSTNEVTLISYLIGNSEKV